MNLVQSWRKGWSKKLGIHISIWLFASQSHKIRIKNPHRTFRVQSGNVCNWFIDSTITELFLVKVFRRIWIFCFNLGFTLREYFSTLIRPRFCIIYQLKKKEKKSIRNWSLRGLSLWRKIVFLSLNLPYQSKAKPDEE